MCFSNRVEIYTSLWSNDTVGIKFLMEVGMSTQYIFAIHSHKLYLLKELDVFSNCRSDDN